MAFSTSTAIARVFLAAGLTFGSTAMAHAQAAPAEPASTAGGTQLAEQGTPADQIGDVIVTAQKREQNVQDVPQAVQVLTGDVLQANGVREFADLTRVAPSLVIKPAENPVNASVSIRGVGTFAFSIGVEPSVAVQVDDVPIAFQARAFADLSDIERIEVLRGPQSTLYGKSASAGLINIVTRAPSDELTLRVGGLITTDQEHGINGAVSGPITPTLGFRINANYNKFEGNIRNRITDDDVNGREIVSLRGKLVWDPTDAVNVTLGLDYIDGTTTIGRPYIRLAPTALLRGNAAFPQSAFAPGIVATEDNDEVVNNVTSGTDYDGFGQSLRGSIDLGGPSLVSITSHDKFDLFDILDQDESAVAALDNRQFGTFTSEQFTQEFRLVSPGADRFRYTLGLFYADVEYSRDFTRGPFFSLARWFATSTSTQYAGFGQLEFDVVDGSTLIGGVRVGREEIAYTYLDIQNGNARFAGEDKDSFSTYKAGFQQRLAPDIMAFVTYATGYKGQTYDLTTGFNTNRALAGPVRPETSKDWQLGVRSQFMDRRLTLNVTVFDTRYKNFQAQGIETLPDGSTNFRLSNVGRLRTRGIEAEASARLGSDLTLAWSAAYLDAEITEFPFAQCFPGQTAAQGCTGTPTRQNLAGARPPQAPEWKATANFDYSPALTDAIDGVLQGTYVYQSRVNYSLNQDPETEQDGFSLVNLSAGVRAQDRRWELVGFVNNLFDKQYFSNLANSRGNFGNQLATQSYLPRDFRRYGGVRASFNF